MDVILKVVIACEVCLVLVVGCSIDVDHELWRVDVHSLELEPSECPACSCVDVSRSGVRKDECDQLDCSSLRVG